MAKKNVIKFSIASLDKMNDRELNGIVNQVMQSKKGASALKTMMRHVMRSALKSAAKSVVKSPRVAKP